jgi:hypothetical protein
MQKKQKQKQQKGEKPEGKHGFNSPTPKDKREHQRII